MYGGLELERNIFLNSALDGNEQLSFNDSFETMETAPCRHWTGRQLSPRSDLKSMAKNKLTEPDGNRSLAIQILTCH
jgi:hypothetical protein